MQSTCVDSTGTPNFAPNLTTSEPHPLIHPEEEGPVEEADDNIMRWYPMRIRFGNSVRALGVRDELQRQGIDHYLHLTEQKVMYDGQLQYRPMPTLCNLIFVHAKKRRIKKLKRENAVCSVIQFMAKHHLDQSQRNEIIYVPDVHMLNFIKAAAMSDPHRQRIPLTYSDFLDKVGQRVRILRGPFCGIEGEVKRIHRNRIVVVLLREARLAIGITQTPPADLEVIE